LKQHNNTAFTRSGMLVPLAISLTLLPACSNNPFGSEPSDSARQGRIITITSSPSGATVRADGNRLGETPLKVNIDKSFTRRWVPAEDYGIVYRVSGKLIIGKSGCDDYTIPVSNTAPAEDIDVTLVCTQQAPAPSPAETEEKATPGWPATADPAISGDVEQRLKKLDKLYRDGVISADEYKQHRNRILGEL
jgi:hypothetical protein